MTRVVSRISRCSVCGMRSKHGVLESVMQFGPADLDLRPPAMARNTVSLHVQECPGCGYVASRISKRLRINPSILYSEAYLTCEGLPFGDDLYANDGKRFYRQYLLARERGADSECFSALLHAAWMCDDNENDAVASLCRTKAAALAEKLLARKTEGRGFRRLASLLSRVVRRRQYRQGRDNLRLIRADLLRRSGQFDKLIEEYSTPIFDDETKEKVRVFQLEKAMEKDGRCYTIADAINE